MAREEISDHPGKDPYQLAKEWTLEEMNGIIGGFKERMLAEGSR